MIVTSKTDYDSMTQGLYDAETTGRLQPRTIGPVFPLDSRVRKLRKMQNFVAYFTDFDTEINIIKCKTEKLKQKT